MKTAFALERQKKVVVPVALSLETARTIAGCYIDEVNIHIREGRFFTNEGHDFQRVLDLVPRNTTGMGFL
jgi:hypothetical protein